jgi:hypothetical protein
MYYETFKKPNFLRDNQKYNEQVSGSNLRPKATPPPLCLFDTLFRETVPVNDTSYCALKAHFSADYAHLEHQ